MFLPRLTELPARSKLHLFFLGGRERGGEEMSEERKGWGKVDMTQERSVRALLPGGCKFGHDNFHL